MDIASLVDEMQFYLSSIEGDPEEIVHKARRAIATFENEDDAWQEISAGVLTDVYIDFLDENPDAALRSLTYFPTDSKYRTDTIDTLAQLEPEFVHKYGREHCDPGMNRKGSAYLTQRDPVTAVDLLEDYLLKSGDDVTLRIAVVRDEETLGILLSRPMLAHQVLGRFATDYERLADHRGMTTRPTSADLRPHLQRLSDAVAGYFSKVNSPERYQEALQKVVLQEQLVA